MQAVRGELVWKTFAIWPKLGTHLSQGSFRCRPNLFVIQLPYSVVYPSDYISKIYSHDQLKIIDAFVADLEASLNVKREVMSFDDLWRASPPVAARGAGLQDFMQDVCIICVLQF